MKIILVAFVVTGLYVFSSFKSMERKPSAMNVIFQGDENLYITEAAVNKLLIQNNQHVTSMAKETLDLNELETALRNNAMVKSAEVYLTVNNEVNVEVVQRKPIARIVSGEQYYIDDEGKRMPLSENRTARVPLVTGNMQNKHIDDVYFVANEIQKDDFLKKNVVEIEVNEKEGLLLKMRNQTFEVQLGGLEHFGRKINNLKAFYQKLKKDKSYDLYTKVNLQFEDQVVCTKK
ncbi:MAG: cell division protein FtsQ/DivIB [bacterium]